MDGTEALQTQMQGLALRYIHRSGMASSLTEIGFACRRPSGTTKPSSTASGAVKSAEDIGLPKTIMSEATALCADVLRLKAPNRVLYVPQHSATNSFSQKTNNNWCRDILAQREIDQTNDCALLTKKVKSNSQESVFLLCSIYCSALMVLSLCVTTTNKRANAEIMPPQRHSQKKLN